MKKKLMIILLSFALAGELFFSGGANLMVQANEIAVEQEMKKESVEQIESYELETNEEQITDETSEDIVILGEKYYVREFNGVKSYFLNPVIRENEITTQSVTTNEEIIWKYFKAKGFSDAGTAGIMGNLLAESGYDPTNLENASNSKSGLTDAQFTAQVNNGTISRSSFISSTQFSQYSYTDSTGTYYTYGFGLAQWTFYSRKANLYDYWKKSGSSSIGDLNMQLDFMYSEMSTSLKNKMISASNVSDACVDFHNIYEGSADTASQIQGRVNNAQNVYNKYHDTDVTPKMTGGIYPTNLAKGGSFTVGGTVSSASKFNWVWMGVNPKGSNDHVLETQAWPESNSYDISKSASKLDFTKLDKGEYTFQVHVITESPNNYYTVVNHAFTVGDAIPKMTGGIYPTNLAKGGSFTVGGTVSSASKFNWVWMGVNPKGSNDHVLETQAWPESNSYDISKSASKLDFTKLDKGEYTFQVHVITENPNNYYTVVNHAFTVGDAIPKMTGGVFPTTIAQGGSFTVGGTVSAVSNFNWVWMGVNPKGSYDHVLETQAWPESNSYDISKSASKLDFTKLDPGEYTFQVHVITANPNEYYVVVNQEFTVVDATPTMKGGDFPSELIKGSNFTVKGTVSAVSNFNWVWMGVNPKGSYDHILETEAWPGSNSYDISKSAPNIDFTKLDPGEYTFQVHVITANPNNYYTVVNQPFIVIEAEHEHSFDNGEITKEATCTETGIKILTCSCGKSRTEYLEAFGHSFDNGTVSTVPTCTEKGVMNYKCTVCGELKLLEMETDSSNHVGNTYIKNAVSATCGKAGYTGDTYCASCDSIVASGQTIKATGIHSWDSGKLTKVPTCTEAGEVTYKCSECKSTRVEKIDSYGHIWKESFTVDKEPTAVAAGSKSVHCKNCNEKRYTTSISKLTPTIKLSVTKKTIKKKKSYTLKISGLAKGDSVASVKTSKKSVATVKKVKSNQYKITGKKKGKAMITVKLKSGKKATCKVTVK